MPRRWRRKLPASALDWPEFHVHAVVAQPDEQSLVLLHVGWPARPQQAATLLVALDRADRRSLSLLSQWCAAEASVSPVRRDGGELELRRRQSLERVHAVLIAEDIPAGPWRPAGKSRRLRASACNCPHSCGPEGTGAPSGLHPRLDQPGRRAVGAARGQRKSARPAMAAGARHRCPHGVLAAGPVSGVWSGRCCAACPGEIAYLAQLAGRAAATWRPIESASRAGRSGALGPRSPLSQGPARPAGSGMSVHDAGYRPGGGLGLGDDGGSMPSARRRATSEVTW